MVLIYTLWLRNQIISNLIKDGSRFLMPLQERTKTQKTAYVKYWRLNEKLSIDKNEGKKVLKKGEIKRWVKNTFSKSKSVGYKKIRMDGYAGQSCNKILTVTSNDAEFKKFMVKFAVGENHFQSNKIVTILSNETGAICRVISPKDKERHPSLLTGQIFFKKLQYDWDYM